MKESIYLMMDWLNERDWISIVEFHSESTMLCNFIRASDENKKKIKDLVFSIYSKSYTDIKQGLNCAFETIK